MVGGAELAAYAPEQQSDEVAVTSACARAPTDRRACFKMLIGRRIYFTLKRTENAGTACAPSPRPVREFPVFRAIPTEASQDFAIRRCWTLQLATSLHNSRRGNHR